MKKHLILITLVALAMSTTQLPAMDQPGDKQKVAGGKQEVVFQECTVCLDEQRADDFGTLTCGHSFCKKCLNSTIETALKSKSTKLLRCPNPQCKKQLEPKDINVIADDATQGLITQLQLEEALAQTKGTKYCPTPDCTYAFIYEDNGQQPNTMQCPTCTTLYCPKCLIPHMNHITCEQAQKNTQADSKISAEEAATRALIENTTKECPQCKTKITRSEGCNKMICTQCGYTFCYRCEDFFKVDPKDPKKYLHTCPDGENYWSKKPYAKVDNRIQIADFDTAFFISLIKPQIGQQLKLDDVAIFHYLIEKWRTAPNIDIEGLKLNGRQITSHKLANLQLSPAQLKKINKATRPYFFEHLRDDLMRLGKNNAPLGNSPYKVQDVVGALDKVLICQFRFTILQPHRNETIPGSSVKIEDLLTEFNTHLHYYGLNKEAPIQTAEQHAALNTFVNSGPAYFSYMKSLMDSLGDTPIPRTKFTAQHYSNLYTRKLAALAQQQAAAPALPLAQPQATSQTTQQAARETAGDKRREHEKGRN